MRTFSLGSGADRKLVDLDVEGRRVAVIERKPDGTSRKNAKEWESEAQARSACEKMARELIARGYLERASTASPRGQAGPPSAPKNVLDMFEEEDLAPMPTRIAPAPVTEAAPQKKAKGKKKRMAKPEGGDSLDKRVIAGAAAAAIAFLAFLGYIAYDTFLVPPSIVGHWVGSKLEYEVSRSLSLTQYDLTLDEQKRAALTIQQGPTSKGTYTLKGDRLKLILKDEDGDPVEVEYKASVGRGMMDLFDPASGKKVVELLRDSKPTAAAPSAAPPAATDLAAGKADPGADAKLASVPYAAPDGAFKVKHPAGWAPESGSRADNSYSWARFTKGSAKVQVTADVVGSLVSGSDHAGQHEEGSTSAPVHVAHLSNLKGVSGDFSDYKEGEPILFKGGLGEGRVAAFTASGGMFSSKIRGLRITFLTGDRRVTVLCQCPQGEFDKLKPTFLAVARAVSY